MQIAGIIENDVVDSINGICVSLWVSGCSHHCKGCHNEPLWDYHYGEDIPRKEVMEKIIDAIRANGLKRNFSVLGGEPLDPINIEDVMHVINRIRSVFKNEITIYLWTGYTIEYLKEKASKLDEYGKCVNKILKTIDILIEGPFIEELKSPTLKLRGSSNQRILLKKHQYGTEQRQQLLYF